MLGASFLCAALAACGNPARQEPFAFTGEAMGTRFNVRLLAADLDPAVLAQAREAVEAELAAVDDVMTTYRESEVTRFNGWDSGEPFEVSAATAEVVALALRLAAETEGALDVTVGPLVEAYGFGPEQSASAGNLEALRARVGYRRLTVDGRYLRKEMPDLEIDLSSVAKGYGVDRAAQALDRLGVRDYMVELGGEVRARGVNEGGESWRIGIERPDASTRRAHRVVPLADMALATSGDYRNYREVEGRRISHLIDPRTGSPIEHRVASATVLHPDCATADGLATALMILGESGLALAEARGWAVLLLIRDGDAFIERESTAFRRLVGSTSNQAERT